MTRERYKKQRIGSFFGEWVYDRVVPEDHAGTHYDRTRMPCRMNWRSKDLDAWISPTNFAWRNVAAFSAAIPDRG